MHGKNNRAHKQIYPMEIWPTFKECLQPWVPSFYGAQFKTNRLLSFQKGLITYTLKTAFKIFTKSVSQQHCKHHWRLSYPEGMFARTKILTKPRISLCHLLHECALTQQELQSSKLLGSHSLFPSFLHVLITSYHQSANGQDIRKG